MPIGLLTLLGGWKNAIILGVLIIMGLVGWYYWRDYQSLIEDHKHLQAEYNTAISINKANEKALALARMQRKQEEAFTQAVIMQRNKREKHLHDQIAMLRTIERPEADRLCPVHPAIEYAVAWLRKNSNTDSGKDTTHSARSPDEFDTVPR